jgi:hypothetical protein
MVTLPRAEGVLRSETAVYCTRATQRKPPPGAQMAVAAPMQAVDEHVRLLRAVAAAAEPRALHVLPAARRDSDGRRRNAIAAARDARL